MKSPHSVYGGRNARPGAWSTPERYQNSPSSSYSDASTIKKRNLLGSAAKSVAGVFAACFTPPETTSSKNFVDSDEFKSSSGKSFSVISCLTTFSRFESGLFGRWIEWIFEFIVSIWHINCRESKIPTYKSLIQDLDRTLCIFVFVVVNLDVLVIVPSLSNHNARSDPCSSELHQKSFFCDRLIGYKLINL